MTDIMKEEIIWHDVKKEGLPNIDSGPPYRRVLVITKTGLGFGQAAVAPTSFHILSKIQNLIAWAEMPKGPEVKK